MLPSSLIDHIHTLQNQASDILTRLRLFPLWQAQGGQPVLVGAVACGLALAPDIDMDIFFDAPTLTQGFAVLQACAEIPGVRACRFHNKINDPDQGYYWRVDYLAEDGTLWKVDMWSVAHDHPEPTCRDMIEPMRRALNDEKRETILHLKAALRNDPELSCPSIYVYQAVLAGGVRDLSGLKKWLAGRDTNAINDWREWLE